MPPCAMCPRSRMGRAPNMLQGTGRFLPVPVCGRCSKRSCRRSLGRSMGSGDGVRADRTFDPARASSGGVRRRRGGRSAHCRYRHEVNHRQGRAGPASTHPLTPRQSDRGFPDNFDSRAPFFRGAAVFLFRARRVGSLGNILLFRRCQVGLDSGLEEGRSLFEQTIRRVALGEAG